MKSASWVIVHRSTGKAVFETFNPETADKVRKNCADTHEVVITYEWLVRLNKMIKESKIKESKT